MQPKATHARRAAVFSVIRCPAPSALRSRSHRIQPFGRLVKVYDSGPEPRQEIFAGRGARLP
jgi:hypothetical protein